MDSMAVFYFIDSVYIFIYINLHCHESIGTNGQIDNGQWCKEVYVGAIELKRYD